MEGAAIQRIPLQLSRDYLVASIQIDLSEGVLKQFRSDLLESLRSSGARGAILDLSGVRIMDGEDFEELRRTMAMAAVMGATPVVCGLQAGVVAALVDLGADIDGIDAARDLDGAFELLDALLERGDETVEDETPPEEETSHDDDLPEEQPTWPDEGRQ